MQEQTTLAAAVSYTGIGLHSGRDVHMRLAPAPVGTGIVFVRTDVAGRPTIRATADHVTSTLRATTLEEHGVRVFTVEHLMSALHARRIDNCYVELDSEEPPVADGASLAFFRLIGEAGVEAQGTPREEVVIDKVYLIDDDEL